MLQTSSLRRALVISVALHAVLVAVAWWASGPARGGRAEVVDIEVAPPAPLPEALPPEVARPPQPDLAAQAPPAEADPASVPPSEPGEGPVDAGVDAPPDVAVDAPPDARPDARIDAAIDAGVDAAPDAMAVAIAAPAGGDGEALDAGVDAAQVAVADAGSDDAEAVAAADLTGDGGSADEPSRVASAAPDAAVAPAIAEASVTAPPVTGDTHIAAGSAAPPPGAGDARIATGSAAAVATADAGSAAAPGDTRIAQGSAAPLDTRALAAALAAGSATPGASDAPAVDGEPTTAGTAANLLSYFPDGHVVTAVIRFDRLRGTEWSAQTERLLRPLPDYRWLFGNTDADLTSKLETLVISSPRPRDAAATTLVARTQLPRPALRDLLAQASPVRWSAATGGLLGKRSNPAAAGDKRLILSPFQGWFVLAQPDDLAGLTAPARGSPNTVVATAKLPPWLAGIRTIESETGDVRGPAVVVTLAGNGKRRKLSLPGIDFGLGIASLPTPERASIAMELVPQGWLVRGNLRFASDADAAELVSSIQKIQRRITGSSILQLAIGKPVAHVVANLAFAQAGPRVSYATSISIADARALLAVAAQQLDQYFGVTP